MKRYIYWMLFFIDSFLVILLLIFFNVNRGSITLEEAYKVFSIVFITVVPPIVFLQLGIILNITKK